MAGDSASSVSTSVLDDLVQGQTVTVSAATRALDLMEAHRGDDRDLHERAARNIVDARRALPFDLVLRARLILADQRAWSGNLLDARKACEEINAEAQRLGERYVRARCEFLCAAADEALGDLPTCRMHAILGVDLLTADAPPAIRVDHLMMLAASYGTHPDGPAQYAAALQLADDAALPDKIVAIHNNLAYLARHAGALPTAQQHVAQMLATADQHGVPLDALRRDTIARVRIDEGRYDDALAIVAPVISQASPAVPARSSVLYAEPEALPKCLLTAATAYRLQGELTAAQQVIDRTFSYAASRHLPHANARAQAAQAELYAAHGDFQRAYDQHIAFHEAITALHVEEQTNRARTAKRFLDADDKRNGVEQFRELAMRDALTGLYNRRFIDDQLARLTARASDVGAPLSAAIADADFFKRVNDQFSHAVGDQVLRKIAALLSSNVVAPETVGRIGGEEFVILMPDTAAPEAYRRCEQLRRAVAEFDWNPMTGDVPVTVSIGIASAPTGQTSPDALMAGADHHLYAAKRSGRNRVVGDQG